jgi:hypothetical protein
MPKIADVPNFCYKGSNRADGVCRLRLYEVSERRIAIASELIAPDGSYANDGISVTNAIAQIATEIVRQFGPLDVLVEHYPPRGQFEPSEETFDFVEQLRWQPQLKAFTDTPHWRPGNKRQVEALIREAL